MRNAPIPQVLSKERLHMHVMLTESVRCDYKHGTEKNSRYHAKAELNTVVIKSC